MLLLTSTARFRLVAALFLTITTLAVGTPLGNAQPAQNQKEIAASAAQFWIRRVGRDTFPAILGDLDGDGHAEVLRVTPSNAKERTLVTVMRTSPLGKPCYPERVTTGFGPRPLAFTCGAFTNRKGRVDVAAVMTNGALQIAFGFEEPPAKAAGSDDGMTRNQLPENKKPRRPKQAGAAKNNRPNRPSRLNRAAPVKGGNKASAAVASDTAPARQSDGDGGDEEDETEEVATASGPELLTRTTIAAMIPPALRPAPPVRALLPADFDGDTRTDILVVDANSKLLLLKNESDLDAPEAEPRFAAQAVTGTLTDLKRLAAGFLPGPGMSAGDHRARLVYLDANGLLFRTVLRFDKPGEAPSLSPGVPLLRDGETVPSSEPLAVGYFYSPRPRGDGSAKSATSSDSADILVGRRLLIGGDREKTIVLPKLPAGQEAKVYQDNAVALVGDLDGNGHDDLVGVHRYENVRISEGRGDDDAMAHFFYDPRRADDPVWSFVSTANDGLPDAWKTGRVKPNGYDLAALGCRVGRQSLIMEVQRVEDVQESTVRAMMQQVIATYAALPTTNPDGSHGITLHVIYRPPIALADSEKTTRNYPPEIRKAARKALEEKYHKNGSFGIAHWMRIKAFGGGVARIMGTVGNSSQSPGVFIHELGHQLGLVHSGHWKPAFSPLYASCMNYHYIAKNWGGQIHYSPGQMTHITLRETALTEHLPIPASYLIHLTVKPYNLIVKPSPNGKSAWVDWNRNGRFDTNLVRADINLDNIISDEPQGDFNDVAAISEYGLSRSIGYLVP